MGPSMMYYYGKTFTFTVWTAETDDDASDVLKLIPYSNYMFFVCGDNESYVSYLRGVVVFKSEMSKEEVHELLCSFVLGGAENEDLVDIWYHEDPNLFKFRESLLTCEQSRIGAVWEVDSMKGRT